MGEIIRDETSSHQQLAVVEKHEAVINYLYPILQNVPRKHGVARDLMLHTSLSAWRGHAQWADTHNVKNRLRLEIQQCRLSIRDKTSSL